MGKNNGKRKISAEAASKIMELERKEYDSFEHLSKIESDLRLIACYVQILWGYLTNENIRDLDRVDPFMEEFENKVDATHKDFLKFQEDLSRTGRLNSRYEGKGEDRMFAWNEVKTKKLPVAF